MFPADNPNFSNFLFEKLAKNDLLTRYLIVLRQEKKQKSICTNGSRFKTSRNKEQPDLKTYTDG